MFIFYSQSNRWLHNRALVAYWINRVLQDQWVFKMLLVKLATLCFQELLIRHFPSDHLVSLLWLGLGQHRAGHLCALNSLNFIVGRVSISDLLMSLPRFLLHLITPTGIYIAVSLLKKPIEQINSSSIG